MKINRFDKRLVCLFIRQWLAHQRILQNGVSISVRSVMRLVWLSLMLGVVIAPITTHAENTSLTPIRVQLLWKHQFEFAGFYAAVAQGYYRDIGLDVELVAFEHGIDIVDEVVSGRAHYGVSDAGLVMQRYHGKPVVLLANLFQHSPTVLITKQSSGIISPAQMVGKRIMLAQHETGNAAILAMLNRESVSLQQMDVINHSFHAEDLITDKVDVMSAYATNEPAVLQQANVPINIIDPINYGIDFYGNNLFTSEKEVAQHPQRVNQFINATLKGWQYALSHPDEIITLILQHYRDDKSQAALEFEAHTLQRFILPEHIPLGHIDPQRMQRIVDIYRQLGFITGNFTLQGFIYAAPSVENRVNLSAEEQAWLKKNPELIVGVDPNWAPFEFIDTNGQYQGMAADYLHLIAKRCGFSIKIQDNPTWHAVMESAKAGHLDILPAVMASPQRQEFLEFTSPHIRYPMVIVSNKESRFIASLDAMEGQKIAVVKGYVTEDLLRFNHPQLNLVTTDDINQALHQVAGGEVAAFVDNLASISHAMMQLGLTNLRISGTTPYQFDLGLAVPKGQTQLRNILQKGLNSISLEEQKAIQKRWINLDYSQVVDYHKVLKMIGVAIIILLIITLWNRRLAHEISSRKLVEAKLSESEQRFRMLFEDNKAVELLVNPDDGQIVEANHAALRFYGYSHQKIKQLKISDINILPPDAVQREIVQAQTEKRDHFLFKHRLASGEIRDVEVHSGPITWGEHQLLYSIIHDVTQKIKLQQAIKQHTEQLSYQATHDHLTGLYNRPYFERVLDDIVSQVKAKQMHAVLLFIDLDGFKPVNDAAGHSAGDELLQQIADMLQTDLRKRDTLARLGGDEFAILLSHCHIEAGQSIAERMRQKIDDYVFVYDNKRFAISLSIGITPITEHSMDGQSILRAADNACNFAKNAGRNRVHVLDENQDELNEYMQEIEWLPKINQALENNAFFLHYQPICPIQDLQQPPHYEVLIRLRNTDGSLIPPQAFIPTAERYNLMRKIDYWVLKNTFAQARPEHHYAINLSGQTINDDKLLSYINALQQRYQVPTTSICFEITETAVISNLNQARDFIQQLRSKGYLFALDDFGSGLSSYAYLKNLEVDFLKIDGAFVKDMSDNPLSHAIVQSINEVAHVIGLKTIAEFVENKAIYERLQQLGVDYVQGYYVDELDKK